MGGRGMADLRAPKGAVGQVVAALADAGSVRVASLVRVRSR